MKVLILGAIGFIGFPMAQAFVRAGHTVYGLACTAAKAKLLATEENAWTHLIPTLDVPSPRTLRAAAAAQETRSANAPLLSYIHTSGTWVHGDNRRNAVTDTTPITAPLAIMSWLPALEQRVVRAPGGRYALIHVEDLADLYARAVEKASLVGGQIFDASNPNTESVDELHQKLVDFSGGQGPYEYSKPANPLEGGISSTALVRPYLANALLGWSAKKQGLTEGLENY
ncbi:hypothetical protein B0H17DRAFT_1156906 [Mycena rosella]|uniref:NAD(P)-binding protein n=1 Tax=Mycena rosella TaxID=1033263 RepID=A0AAD7M7V3_MYCRO|nr:hypothetical protein B0H17DRAFT_1156906 [Mycena rosella]